MRAAHTLPFAHLRARPSLRDLVEIVAIWAISAIFAPFLFELSGRFIVS